MINFELKKLFKKKYLLIILILAIFMSVYNLITVESKFTIFDLDNSYSDIDYLQYKYIDMYENKKIEKDNKFLKEIGPYIDDLEKLSNFQGNEKEKLEKKIELANYYEDFFEKFDYINPSKEELDIIEWTKIESKYYLENNVFIDLDWMTGEKLFRMGVDSFFGLIPMIVLAFLSYEILSKEFENNTIINYYTAPKNRSRIIIAKFLSLIIYGIIYIILVLLFTYTLGKIKGLNMDGLNRGVRILGDGYKFITIYEYIGICTILFLLLLSFIFSLSLMLQAIFRMSSISLIGLSILFILSYIFDTINIFNYFNILSLSKYKEHITGYFQYYIPFTPGIDYPDLIPRIGYRPYMLIFVASLIFIGISYFSLKYNYKFSHKESKTIKNINFFKFNQEKIRANIPRFIFTIASLLIIVVPYISFILKDKEVEYNNLNDNVEIKNIEEEIEESKKTMELLNGTNNLSTENFQETIKDQREVLEKYKNLIKYYEDKNGSEFYKLQKDLYTKNITYQSYIDYFNNTFKDGTLSEISKIISEKRIEEFENRNIKPFYNVGVFVSAYDEFNNYNYFRSYLNDETPNNHQALYSIYRANNLYNIQSVLLVFILIFFLGSWTYDKEKGDKLSFLFTKPVNKSKYHIEIIKNQIINITTYILLMFLLSMVIYSIFSGVGELNLPIVKYNGLSPDKNSSVINQSKYYSFMNLSTYILKYVFALILVAIFIGSVTNILSLYVDKTINLYICTFIFLGLGILLVNMIDMDIIQLILPFGYLNPSKVRTGEIIVKYGNSNMTYLMGIVSLIGWSIINNIFSFIILDDKL